MRFRLNKSPAPSEVKNTRDLTAIRLDLSEGVLNGTVRFVKQKVSASPAEIEAALDTFLDSLGVR